MKLGQESVEVLSNVKTQQTAYSFSDNAQDAALAIDVITSKGYKFKISTPVQEYLCNARDAHREIGQKKQIEVTAPTVFDPVFKVRDFGPGISPEKMVTVFVKFFASTKRRDNKMTGGFGLGAKSAWAYSDSFGIVSIENGMKRTYTAYKAGQGMLQPETEVATTEPSGLEISIPVKPQDIKAFEKAIKRAIYFWSEEERPNVLNMEMTYPVEPKTFGRFAFYDQKQFSEVVSGNNSNYGYNRHDTQDRIVLDGVIYELQREDVEILKLKELDGYDRKVCSFFLICKTGELSITPFRENIEFNEHTIETLKKFITNGFKVTQTAQKQAMEKALTIAEKVKVIEDFTNIVTVEDIKLNEVATYRQGQITFSFSEEQNKTFSVSRYDRSGQKMTPVNPKKRGYGSHRLNFSLDKSEFFSFVTATTESDLMARKKVAQYAEKNKDKTVYFFSFDQTSVHTKDLVLNVIPHKSTEGLTYEKTAPKARTVRSEIAITDYSGKMTSLEKEGKVLNNLLYLFASQTKGNHGVRNFATLMKSYGYNVVSINKGDEKFVIARGGKTMEQVLETVKFEEKDLIMLMKSNTEDYYAENLICLNGMFKNKTIAKYLDMHAKVEKMARKDSSSFRYLDFLHTAIQNDTVYKEMLNAQEEGVNMIKKDFPIIMNLDNHMIPKMKEELKVYIQGKEKQLGVKNNG